MIPFYGIDRTTLKKSTFHEGDCFIAAEISDFTRQSYEQAVNSMTDQISRAQLSPVLGWIRTGCGWVTFLIFIGILRALGNVTLTEAYENAPFLFWGLAGCAVVWILLAVLNRRKVKSVTESEAFTTTIRRLEGEIDRINRELGVPENAKEVDVVQLTFRWKDGKVKISTQGSETTPYTNVSMSIFRREDVLCFVDREHRYELPVSQLRCLRRVKKPLVIQGWTKDEPINSEFYKPYKLSMDNYERVHTKSYGLLELTNDGIDWAVWLPPYELNYISALTGLPITEA